MQSIQAYLQAMRPRHYVKNLLLFVPLFFSGQFLRPALLGTVALVFVLFSLFCSAIYVINDLVDYPYDVNHPVKRHRPIASGRISRPRAMLFAATLSLLGMAGLTMVHPQTALVALAYFLLNIAYSLWLKRIPLLDVFCIATGFVLRVYVGSTAVGVVVSHWLLLTILCASLFLAFGKRRNELLNAKADVETRAVLKSYHFEFLDKSMFAMMTLTVTFYALWALDTQQTRIGEGAGLLFTVPLVILALLRYMSIIEGASYGDPTDVILRDKFLLVLAALLAGMMGFILYM